MHSIRLMRLSPWGSTRPDLHLLREVCLVNLGQYREAVSELRGLVATETAPPAAYADLGWLLSEWMVDTILRSRC